LYPEGDFAAVGDQYFSNISFSRGEIALAACGCRAIWLRRCGALRRLVAAAGDPYFSNMFATT